MAVALLGKGGAGGWEGAGHQAGHSPPPLRFSQVDATDIVCLMAPYIWMAPVGLVTSRLGHELAESPGTTAPSPFDTMGHAEDETRGEGDSVKVGRRGDARRRVGPRPPPDAEWPSRKRNAEFLKVKKGPRHRPSQHFLRKKEKCGVPQS